jgi:isopenicillin N synthase-like dioxygenase
LPELLAGLDDSGIDALPCADAGDAEVPLVDLSQAGASEAIAEACRDWGMFAVLGHGFAPTRIELCLAEMRRFFARPLPEKQALSRSLDNPWGFNDRELTKNRRDRKQVFDIGPDQSDPADPFGGTTPWPEVDPVFAATMRGWKDACEVLSDRLLALIFAGLGESAATAEAQFRPFATGFLRLNRYPLGDPLAGPDPRDGARAVHHHTDAGALTVLLEDGTPGLQVLRDGRWHDVRPRPGALIINIGDMVEVWSNGLYPAPVHRVLAMDARERVSAPYFHNPAWGATIAPLPGALAFSGAPRFHPIPWAEFRRRRAEGDFGDYGAEVQIGDWGSPGLTRPQLLSQQAELFTARRILAPDKRNLAIGIGGLERARDDIGAIKNPGIECHFRQHGQPQAIIDHLHQSVQAGADHGGRGAQFRAVAGGQRLVFQAMPVFEQQKPVFVDQAGQDLVGRVARIVLGKGDVEGIEFDGFLLHFSRRIGQGKQHAIGAAMVQRFHRRRARLLAQEQF